MPASIAATSSRDKGCLRSTPETSPTKTGWIWRMETAIAAKLLKCPKGGLYARKTGRNDTLMSQICHVGPRRSRIERRWSLRKGSPRRNLAKTSPAGPRSTTIMRPVFLLFALLLSLGVAHAQSLEEIDKRQAALIE